jgi:hypothetical protein
MFTSKKCVCKFSFFWWLNVKSVGVTEVSHAMRCSQCNRDQTAGKFCIKCGGKLLDAPTASTIRCTRCNKEQNAGKFCMNCGERLLDGSPATVTVSNGIISLFKVKESNNIVSCFSASTCNRYEYYCRK